MIDLLAPLLPRGGKIGLFGGAGVGKTVTIMELINNSKSPWWIFSVWEWEREQEKKRSLS